MHAPNSTPIPKILTNKYRVSFLPKKILDMKKIKGSKCAIIAAHLQPIQSSKLHIIITLQTNLCNMPQLLSFDIL